MRYPLLAACSICACAFLLVAVPKSEAASCLARPPRTVGSIVKRRIDGSFLRMINAERAKKGLTLLKWNPALAATAQEWSEQAGAKGEISHVRPSDPEQQDYNYNLIEKETFNDRGIQFSTSLSSPRDSRFSENIGWGALSRPSATVLIRELRKLIAMFIAEGPSGPHYRTVLHPGYTDVGMGFTIVDGTFYMTMHYGRMPVVSASTLCPA